ncbi:YggS family pyridoxal phosphate-dependent enzyme [Ornithinimicrobium sediminis]|uniref:YggS family pyridoxal phosphate-dependent enzyme n=1 Tax=Ornithinimicrobium sediminis TaxID=2904603 RepID=UPI001E3263D6|nr:YggS family pyridoxal phosphate-dependent enzyme [Ornithinimicrobium sediminis]
MSDRGEELSASLGAVRERIRRACEESGRSEEEVTLVVVTKFFPAADAVHLIDLGVRDLGENRDQEASAKVAELGELVAPELWSQTRMHFIGQVQTKKARSVARYADVVQSVDRPKLVRALDRAVGAAVEAGERSAPLDVTVQLDLEEGERTGRGGIAPSEAPELADLVAGTEHLRLRGVMAVAPPDLDADGRRKAFERIAASARQIRGAHPDADWVSAGMSGDLEDAIAVGATHLRVGSAILGSRQSHR